MTGAAELPRRTESGPSNMPRRNALLLFALATVLGLGAACPHTAPQPPPEGGVDAGVPDASVACALSGSEDAGAPWANRCESPPVDVCASLVLPAAGPVPSADRWCEESAQRLCAAGVDAGEVEPGDESRCVETELQRCEARFPSSRREAGSLTYWPEAASACLTGEANPSSPACRCAFVGSSVGGPCDIDAHCRTGYCLKGASDAGVCVACPDKRPVGSACGRPGDAPCDGHGYCSQGCCAPRANVGEACRNGLIEPKPCDTGTSSECRQASIEDMSGFGTCKAYRQLGQTCGKDPAPHCRPLPPLLCQLGTCEAGLTCTVVSLDASAPRQCEPMGIRCDADRQGCGPGQRCTGPSGRCVTPGSLMEGEECHGPDLCAKGLLCRQQADAGTGPSQVCVAAGPRECSYDVDCPFWDQQCRNGFCAPGTVLGEACDNASACVQGLVCANGADGGICAPRPRLGERCYYAGPDGGPLWWNSCMESSCDLTTGVCQ